MDASIPPSGDLAPQRIATLTVMPQVYGANFDGDPDGNHHLELEGHERWNVRLIFGFNF